MEKELKSSTRQKIFNFLLFTMLAFITCIFNVKAETRPDNVVIDTNGEYYQKTLFGRDYLPTQGFTSTITSIRKKAMTGDILYCAQEEEAMPAKNSGQQTWKYKKVADYTNELDFVWENGYHGQTNYSATEYLTGDPDTDYFLTGMAVWKYTQPADSLSKFGVDSNGNYDGTYSGYSNEVSQKIAKLINAAKGYKKNPSLKINVASNKLTLTEDKKYYISNPITFSVKDLTSNISVSVSGDGAFVTSNKNSTSGNNSFPQGSTIYIKIPADKMSTSSQISINATATGIKYVAYIYEHTSNPEYQLLSRFVKEDINDNDAATFSTDKINVIISKKDITGSKEVKGATLIVKKGNTEILKWVSDGNDKKISLDTGEYTLEETIAPAGYKLNTEKINFKVNGDGTVTVGNSKVDKVIMKNEPFYTTISKLGLEKDKQLEGATLKITNKEGTLTKDLDGKSLTWVTTSTKEKFHLAAGTYYLTEEKAPNGYTKSNQKVEFVVAEDGTITVNKKTVSEVTLENIPFYITISKLGVNNDKQLEGATLKITNKEGTLTKDLDGKSLTWVTTSTKEKFHLAAGTYYLTEEKAPNGYIKSNQKVEFVVAEDGTITVNKKTVNEVTLKNDPIYVYISKKSINGKTELPGATLKITSKDGTLEKDLDGNKLTWTTTNKEKKFHLAPGDYILTELEAPKGYELSESVIEFTITEEGKILYNKQETEDNMIVFKNTPEPEPVKTGSTILYVLFLGIITSGIVTYFVYKKNLR